MSRYRKCGVCGGASNLWKTPNFVEEGGLLSSSNPEGVSKGPDSTYAVQGGGMSMPCWQCLGKGVVPDRDDSGDTNG